MKIIITYFLIVFNFSFVQLTHFSGGTVTWKPLNNTGSNSMISIMITQSYQWRRSYIPYTYCNDSYILNRAPFIPTSSGSLVCVTTPSSSCGGYSVIPAQGYCTDFSSVVDSSSSQMSTVLNITAGSKFCVAFNSGSWVTLRTNCGTSTSSNTTISTTTTMSPCYNTAASWSVGCCIDLSLRLDGFINLPPVASIMSPLKIPINTLTNINIPVIDADNDVLRCRWAKTTSVLDECADACGEIAGSTLYQDNCTLSFDSTGKHVGDYFAVTLMVEDFYTESTTTPFSSIPIQFLIKIVATPICPLKPTISSNLSICTPIKVGIQFNITILITQGCSGTTINDFFRMPPLNMYKSGLTQVGASNVWTITEIWTPTSDQIGSQVYCAIATDSASITSNTYCTTFTVVPFGQTLSCPTEHLLNRTTVTSTTSTTSTTTTVTTRTTTSSATSTSSATTTSTSSETTTSTSSETTTSTSSETATSLSTTQTNQPIIVTVLVPVQVTRESQPNNLTLGIGLGLGLPLLLLLLGLILYLCCCKSSNKCFRRYAKRTRSIHEQANTPNYRQQYIKDNRNSYEKYQLTLSSEIRSLTSMALPDFELNDMNMTKTSFFSPSICSLPTDKVQHRNDYISSSINSMQNESILIRAYSVQERRQTPYTS